MKDLVVYANVPTYCYYLYMKLCESREISEAYCITPKDMEWIANMFTCFTIVVIISYRSYRIYKLKEEKERLEKSIERVSREIDEIRASRLRTEAAIQRVRESIVSPADTMDIS
jgi:hypothetical protein